MIGGAVDEGKSGSGLLVGTGLGGLGGGQIECLGLGDQIVEIGGLQSEIAAGNVAVVVFAYALVALCVAAYFLFFRNTDTGTNADEKLSGDYPV
jgi:preprotein translocase subunit YajC